MMGEGDINNPLAAERRGLGTSGGRCQSLRDSGAFNQDAVNYSPLPTNE